MFDQTLLINTIPSLQGTLAKHTKPTLQPNFAKEPFRPSLGLRNSAKMIDIRIENINRQCLTHNIKQLGFSGLRAFVPALVFSSVDTDAARKPNRFIL